MNSHCFPFRQVPHTTRLFLDFLERAPSIEPFYRRSPFFLEWAPEEAKQVQYPEERRSRMADILRRQNERFGASAQTLQNVEAFRSGALAIVTGQQVGLLGGPVFSIFKALSAVKLVLEARKLGIECVPVFWLATEDHDLEEVNQARLPGPDGQLEKLTGSPSGGEGEPVATIRFGAEIEQLTQRAKELIGENTVSTWISECYLPGADFGAAFAKFFAKVFGEYGVILLDASDPELDAIAAPVYREAVQRAPELNRALLDRDQQLHAAGYHQQVRITDTSTPFFLVRNGARVPVHMNTEGTFQVGDEQVSKADLLGLVDTAPQSFSPNVLLRPVVQDYLLPTLAYIGGAAEVAYFAQIGALYESLSGRVTPILPRFSATLIEPKPQSLLEKYGLSFPDLFQGVDSLREQIGSRLLDPKLQASFDGAEAAVQRAMSAVRDTIANLDKTLVESANNAESKMLHQLTALRSRAARAELRQSEVAERHARLLSNALYPDKNLQERELAGAYFLARYGRELLSSLLGVMNPACVDHQLVAL